MTRAHLLLPCLILLAYLMGSIPFGLLVGKAHGIDPRISGSGNIGATNLGRLLGIKFFALVFTLDVFKSLVPMLAASWIVHGIAAASMSTAGWQLIYLLWILVGFAAIAGHMYSIFLGLKGGKGVATSCGVLLGLYPYYTWPGLLVMLVWIMIFVATRYVSVASIAASVVFPIAFVALGLGGLYHLGIRETLFMVFAVLVGGMIVYKHRGNIARLVAGTEPRIAKKTERAAARRG